MAVPSDRSNGNGRGSSHGEPLYRVIGLLANIRKRGPGYEASCPGPKHANGDRHPSLSVRLGDDGRVLLKCHAGCETSDVLQRMGLTYSDLFERSRDGNMVKRFRLMDPKGKVLAEHVREDKPDGKVMWWERNGKNGLAGLPAASLPLYRGAHVAAADPRVPVVVCEGEAAAEAAAELGLLAVGTVTGADGTPSDDVLLPLKGHVVWLWPDNDDAGRQHMARIAERLDALHIDVRWVAWPDAPPKGDAADYARSGGTAEGIAALVTVPPSRTNGHAPEHADEPIAPFPLRALPDVLRQYVEESATALVAPPDLVAVPLLTLTGAVIGNARHIEVKRGWREGPNLYTAVITPPGGKKTPSGSAAKRPIYRVQDRLKREHEAAAVRHREAIAEWEALSKVGRAGQKPPDPPRFGHVVTTDATTEAIASMLQGCKGLVLERDELSGWTRSMDQYRGGKGADRQHFLSMWSRGALKVDRKGAPPIFVPNPCLSVTGGIQPDMLSELIDTSGREDGFIDRILLSYPAEIPDRWTDDEVRLTTLIAVEDLFEALYELPDEAGGEAGTVRLSGEARELWKRWYEANAAEQQAPDFPPQLRGPWAKMPSQFLRIALILHVVTWPDALLMPPAIVEATADVIAYFKSHARRVYGCLSGTRRDMGARILDAIDAHDGRISMTDLMVDVFQRHQTSERIRAELERLEALGAISYEKQTRTGGRPREEWVRA